VPLPIKSYQQLMMWNPAPLQEIIGDGILYEQTKMVLFGGPKLGKSVLAQQITFCLVMGIPWLGFPVKTSSVLYLQAEISEVLFKSRMEKMGAGKPIPQDKLHTATISGFHLDKGAAASDLFQAVDHYKPNIVIIDPKYKFVSSNDENSIIHFTDAIDQIILKYGVAVVVIEHSRKPKMSNQGSIVDMGGFELRGPIIEQWADSIIRLKGDLSSDLRIMEFELRHAVNMLPAKQLVLDRNSLWFLEVK
jgi:RecA-family ATPase